MKLPALQPGEEWRVRSPRVWVKALPFTAFLTSVRIILVNPGTDTIPGRDLALASIEGIEYGENGRGEPFLVVLARSQEDLVKRLVLTFAELPGNPRTDERDSWVQWISRYGKLRSIQIPVIRVQDPAQDPSPLDLHGNNNEDYPKGCQKPTCRRHDPEKNRIVPSFIGSDQGRQKTTGPITPAQEEPVMIDVTVREIPHRNRCGESRYPASFFCMGCGNRVPFGAKFCNRCGATVIPPSDEVVRSPWDNLASGQDPAALAAQWGVPVGAPGSPAPTGHGNYGYGRPGASGQSPTAPGYPYSQGAWGAPPQQKIRIPGSAFPARTAAIVAVVIVFTSILIAATAGYFPGFGISSGPVTGSPPQPDNPSPDNNEGKNGMPGPEGSTRTVTDDKNIPVSTVISNSPATNTASVSATPIPATGTYLRITSPGSWEGTYGEVPAVWAVRGFGEKVYKVDDKAGSVSASFKKSDVTASDLVVELYRNGEVIRSGNTAAPQGKVSLAAGL